MRLSPGLTQSCSLWVPDQGLVAMDVDVMGVPASSRIILDALSTVGSADGTPLAS